ncbi:regulator of DNA class I crossover intermediates 1 isoform X3 [Macaca nemestrina]|uniref:regulator of DNA class I crossover intermediates 1 isoform X3 n=1 Tax=Macaca nemestrina TaxID=9545 RepID=UPI0039B9CF4B
MNWVGGSRSRVLIKQERRKQKEYFEKHRLKSKMKSLGVLSPVKNSAVSLDILNLYMVNQISCKKKIPETVRKPTHVNMNRGIKMPLRKHNLELPISPHCVPSKLCLDDTETNINYQRLSSKEDLGPVQSQGMDSYTTLDPQFSKIENCSFTPTSFSVELASNRHISKLNFTPGIAPTPQKLAYEKKQNDQLNKSQDVLSPSHKTTQFGTLFERLNRSLGNRNLLTKCPAVIMDEDCRSMDEIGQSDYITEKHSIQHIWRKNGKKVSNFLEDVNQSTPNFLSENSDSFVSQNMINVLNIDQQKIKKTFNKCDYDSMGDICVATHSDKNRVTDRCIRNIFTVPELTFSNSTLNKTSYPEKCQPNKKNQREYNKNERNDLSTSFENDYYPSSSERKGKLENDYQERTPQKSIQKYPANSMGNIPSEELHYKQSWDFGLDEILMEEGGICSLKSRPTSTEKISLDSAQSSWSTSYSPRPTDSCFSSSSDVPSEDEDQISQHIEDSNRMPIKTKENTNNFYVERMAKVSGDRIVKNNDKIHKQNENFYQFSVKNNTDQFPQSQCNSAHILQNKTSDNCILQPARCDAGVQTESESVMEEKLDAAIQCDLISKCTCRSDVSLCNLERCSENIKTDTTGGQEILKNN